MKLTTVFPVGVLRGSVGHKTGALPAESVPTSSITCFVWKGIQVARQLVLPANPSTPAQQEVRNLKTSLARAWSVSLSAPERTGWITWAGENGYVDGFQALQALAWIGYAYNATLITAAPSAAAPSFAATLDSVVADISSASLTPTFSGVAMSPAQDVLVLCEWTIAKVPGAQSVRDTDYRTAAATVATSIILDTDPTAGGLLAPIASGLRTTDTLLVGDRRYARYKVYDLATGIHLWTGEKVVTMQA